MIIWLESEICWPTNHEEHRKSTILFPFAPKTHWKQKSATSGRPVETQYLGPFGKSSEPQTDPQASNWSPSHALTPKPRTDPQATHWSPSQELNACEATYWIFAATHWMFVERRTECLLNICHCLLSIKFGVVDRKYMFTVTWFLVLQALSVAHARLYRDCSAVFEISCACQLPTLQCLDVFEISCACQLPTLQYNVWMCCRFLMLIFLVKMCCRFLVLVSRRAQQQMCLRFLVLVSCKHVDGELPVAWHRWIRCLLLFRVGICS